jgi:hypothetical protein
MGGQSAPRPGRLTPRKDPVPFCMRLCVSLGRSGRPAPIKPLYVLCSPAVLYMLYHCQNCVVQTEQISPQKA